MNEVSSQLPPSLMEEAICFKVGLTLRVGGTIFQIVRILSTGDGTAEEFVLKHLESGELRRATPNHFAGMRPGIDYFVISQADPGLSTAELLAENDQQRKFIKRLPLDGKSSAQIKGAVLRIRWLDHLHRAGYVGFKASNIWQPDLLRIAKEADLPLFTAETLAQWELDFTEGGGAKLIPRYDLRGGKGIARTDGRAEDILARAICQAKQGELTTLQVKAVHAEMSHQINVRNKEADQPSAYIPAPSLSTVNRRFNASVSIFERDVDRLGIKAAERKHRATSSRPSAEFPGAIYEFDDLDTKVFAIDERTGLPWGRPFITYGLDAHPDYPVGLSFGKAHRSAVSAVAALVHSIEPKQAVVGPDGKLYWWRGAGYPCLAIFDNALYNNERIVGLNVDLFDVGWTRSRTPTEKSGVEYLNRQTMAFLRTLDGWRGPKGDPDAIKAGMATALFPMERLRLIHLNWLIGTHIHEPMGDGFTRDQKYEATYEMSFRGPLPADVRRLRMLKMRRFRDSSTWTRSGLRVIGLTYQDEDLYRYWINRAGGSLRVHVCIDDDDIGQIYIDIPGTDLTLELPCLQRDYARGLTLYQHQLIRKLCYERKIHHPSLVEMYAARHDLCVMLKQWRESGKVRERCKAVRAGDIVDAKDTVIVEAAHDAEIGCDQLDAVEMEQGDVGWQNPIPG